MSTDKTNLNIALLVMWPCRPSHLSQCVQVLLVVTRVIQHSDARPTTADVSSTLAYWRLQHWRPLGTVSERDHFRGDRVKMLFIH